jgi:hypothetical protein
MSALVCCTCAVVRLQSRMAYLNGLEVGHCTALELYSESVRRLIAQRMFAARIRCNRTAHRANVAKNMAIAYTMNQPCDSDFRTFNIHAKDRFG